MPGRSSAPVSIDAAPSGEHTVSDAPCSLRMTLWTFLYLANVIDVAFSCYAFSRGCGELNPVIELVWDKWGLRAYTSEKHFPVCPARAVAARGRLETEAPYPVLQHVRLPCDLPRCSVSEGFYLETGLNPTRSPVRGRLGHAPSGASPMISPYFSGCFSTFTRVRLSQNVRVHCRAARKIRSGPKPISCWG